MFEFTEDQEKVFEIFDALIDEGESVWEVIQACEALRKRCNRAFPNIEGMSKIHSAMLLYGFNDFSYTPSILDLHKIVYVDEYFDVQICREGYSELLALCNIEESTLNRLLKDVIHEVKLEAVSELVMSYGPDEISYKLLEEYNKLRAFIHTEYKSMDDFRNTFGIDNSFNAYTRDYSRALTLIDLGKEFERILSETCFKGYHNTSFINGCVPDFVLGDMWVDAKLAKGTALQSSVTTIPKYLEHVDDLTIVYALEDDSDISNVESEFNVHFKHVSEFYDQLNNEVIKEIETFIERAEIVKGLIL